MTNSDFEVQMLKMAFVLFKSILLFAAILASLQFVEELLKLKQNKIASIVAAFWTLFYIFNNL